jgi:hypothetical protein
MSVGADVSSWPLADIRRVHVNVCFSGKSGHGRRAAKSGDKFPSCDIDRHRTLQWGSRAQDHCER